MQDKSVKIVSEKVKNIYGLKKDEILLKLENFKQIWLSGDDEKIFVELAFCILTPQSKARLCWNAVLSIEEKGLFAKEDVEQIEKELHRVRFKNKKARYIVASRKFLTNNGKLCIKSVLSKFNDIYECRAWLVENIVGIGCKEASHFLRNIGLGKNIAILDRHILENLKQLGVIEDIPKSISKAKYLLIEKDMKEFARQIGIPLLHLDLVLWCKETGEVFK